MLSTFPELLFLAPLASTLIRLALAILFGYCAWTRLDMTNILDFPHLRNSDLLPRAFAIAEIAITFGLVAGAWTQPAAMLGTAVVLMWLLFPGFNLVSRSTAALSLVMCCALLLLGPGAFAFDLPL